MIPPPDGEGQCHTHLIAPNMELARHIPIGNEAEGVTMNAAAIIRKIKP